MMRSIHGLADTCTDRVDDDDFGEIHDDGMSELAIQKR